MAANLPYTCNTCFVAFRSSDGQRDHMRTDWQYVIGPTYPLAIPEESVNFLLD